MKYFKIETLSRKKYCRMQKRRKQWVLGVWVQPRRNEYSSGLPCYGDRTSILKTVLIRVTKGDTEYERTRAKCVGLYL